MKLHVLAVLLFCMMGRFSSAQADSLQRYLIPPIGTTLTTFPYTTVLPFDELPYWQDVPPYYPPRYEDWWDELTMGTYTLVFVLPTCGDTYHANGQLASRISCKDSVFDGLTTYWNEKGVKTSETNYVNGKPEGKAYSWSANGVKTSERTYVNGKEHGKTILWDDNGHKLYEYTYAYGRYFKAKTYGSRGQLESVDHYTYTKAGNQVLHGLSINYGDNAKEINRYKNGKMDGINQWFKQGKLIREQRYKADNLLEQKTWSQSQHLIGHNTYNSTGQIEHLQSWDTSGVLLKEEFHHNSRCIGIWTSYYPPTESKTLTYFTDINEPAQLLKKEVFSHAILTHRYIYTNGQQTDVIQFFDNGHQRSHRHTDANQDGWYLAWNDHLVLTDSMTYSATAFKGSGYFSEGDTAFVFNNLRLYDPYPISRWVLLHEDTLRQEYVLNSTLDRHQVIKTNTYAKNAQGDYVRSGLWSFYKGNVISHAVTYVLGDVTGRAVYYTQTDSVVQVSEFGFYTKGLKDGTWTVLTDSTLEHATYVGDVLNGTYHKTTLLGDTLCVGHYIAGEKSEYWAFFDANGDAVEAGYYDHNVRVGKWVQYYVNSKGLRKKRKVKY